MGVTAMPQIGRRFGLTCTNAPPVSTQGLLLIGLAALDPPAPAKGAGLWVSPTPTFLFVPVASNELGALWLEAQIPNIVGLVGATIDTQFFWPNPCSPTGSLSASNALSITFQS
jgi:hypothetical protein